MFHTDECLVAVWWGEIFFYYFCGIQQQFREEFKVVEEKTNIQKFIVNTVNQMQVQKDRISYHVHHSYFCQTHGKDYYEFLVDNHSNK